MAYNVLKGTVEFSGETNGKIENMVDTHSNQTVAGTKNFTGTVSASAFWDTTTNAAVPAPAVTAVANGAQYRIATFGSTSTLNGEANLSFDASTLALTGNFTATSITGAAGGITNVPPNQFSSAIPASQIALGNTMTGSDGVLGVRSSGSIRTGSNGVYLYVDSEGGLDLLGDGALRINPSTCLNITNGGQTLAGTDLLPVWDVTAADIRYTTLAYLYSNYLSSQVPQPAGSSGHVQLTNGSAFVSDSALTFNTVSDTLTTPQLVCGNVSGSHGGLGELFITGSMHITGSAQTLLKLHALDAETKEIMFAKDGSEQATIQINANEHFIFENSGQKDIIMKTNNQNTIRIYGQNQRVAVNKAGVSPGANLDLAGTMFVTGTLSVTGSLAVSGAVQNNIITVQGNYPVQDHEYTIIYMQAAERTITLPTVSGSNVGRVINVRKSVKPGIMHIASETGYLDGMLHGQEGTIRFGNDGPASAQFQSDGTSWMMLFASGSYTFAS